jgi:hypothetical protein
MGSEKQVQAAKDRWSRISLATRKKLMKPKSEARWKGVSKKKRREQAILAAAARWNHKKGIH